VYVQGDKYVLSDVFKCAPYALCPMPYAWFCPMRGALNKTHTLFWAVCLVSGQQKNDCQAMNIW